MTGLRSRLSEAAGKFWEVLRGTGKDGRDGEDDGAGRDGRTGADGSDLSFEEMVIRIGERKDIVAASGFFYGEDGGLVHFLKGEKMSAAAWLHTFCDPDSAVLTNMIISALVAAMVKDDRLFMEFDELYEGFLRDRRKLKEI